jgi:carboxylate-amine ligase
VAALVNNPQLGAQRTTHTRRIVDENRWRAKRDGIHAHFIAQASSDAAPAAQVLRELLTMVNAEGEELECGQVLMAVKDILARGTSAHEQLRVYEAERRAGQPREAALAAVIDWLARVTMH